MKHTLYSSNYLFEAGTFTSPNQALEPTIPGVTPRAEPEPRVAPPGIVAHLERSAMKLPSVTIAAVLLTGCIGCTSAPANRKITDVVAVVKSYNELTPLEVKKPEPNYFSIELEIVSPAELRGAFIDAESATPLKEDNPLRRVGSTLSLAIKNLQRNRGSSSLGDGSAWHVLYSIEVADVKKLTVN